MRRRDDLLIERRERAKVPLHQESPTSIAADAIACRLSCWRAGQLRACPRGGARARGRGRAPADPRHTKLIHKNNIKKPRG